MEALPQALWENEIDYNLDKDLSVIDGYQRRILTGMRPSGLLHVGHYAGALKNWLEFQKRFRCDFLIADLHALADHADNPGFVRQSIIDVTTDWLATGLDPNEANFCVQTGMPELAELTVLIQTMYPWARLADNPTLKTELAALAARGETVTVSFMTYPISQAADILAPMGDLVPAGADQRPMVELARKIADRFNRQYGTRGFHFPLPQMYQGAVPRLVGTDGGQKMGKSLRNTINLSDSKKIVDGKVSRMPSANKRREDPGVVDGHVVFTYLDAFHRDTEELTQLKADYERGGVGEGDLKAILKADLQQLLEPIRDRRLYFEAHPDEVMDALRTGTARTRARLQETLAAVRDSMELFR